MQSMSLGEISKMAKGAGAYTKKKAPPVAREVFDDPEDSESEPIHIKAANKGLLHKKLGVPAGDKIPAAKVAAAKKSASPALRKEATFAQNAAQWRR